jgi:hypothetical protein
MSLLGYGLNKTQPDPFSVSAEPLSRLYALALDS